MQFQIPIFYSGPYSFDAAPCEKLFAIIKRNDLNPLKRNFKNRNGCHTYIQWLAEVICQLHFGDVTSLFRKALEANEKYLLFEDI